MSKKKKKRKMSGLWGTSIRIKDVLYGMSIIADGQESSGIRFNNEDPDETGVTWPELVTMFKCNLKQLGFVWSSNAEELFEELENFSTYEDFSERECACKNGECH